MAADRDRTASRLDNSAPGSRDQVLVSEAFAEAHGLQLGDVIHGNFNQRRRTLKIVGVALSPEFVYAIGPETSCPIIGILAFYG